MSIVNDNTSAVLEKALSLRFKRQQLLAANIANADTPSDRPVDLAFEGALKDAINKDDSADPNPPAGCEAFPGVTFKEPDAMIGAEDLTISTPTAVDTQVLRMRGLERERGARINQGV